jgi:hypothetical protein
MVYYFLLMKHGKFKLIKDAYILKNCNEVTLALN